MAEIASIFVSPIVSSLTETVATLIHDKYVAIKGVKENLEKLLDTLETIRAVLEDAEQRSAYDRSLKLWLSKIKDAAFDAEDILDTFAAEARLGKVRRHRVASEIKKLSARLDLIAKNRSNFNLIGRSGSQSPNDFPLTSSFVETTDVFGRESDKQRLIDQMLSNESDSCEGGVSVIPIIGMGGLGKTTIAQLIFNDGRVKDHFEYRMWVCVTIDFNLKRILKGIIEFHTQMEVSNNLSFNGLVSRFKDILSGKIFLLVLDDVWVDNYQEWEPLRNILKLGGKGSRILVTSRSERVSNIMGTQTPYRLEYLPQEECWSLFKRIAFKDCNSVSSSRLMELEGIGREIVDKCNGLPLAVKAMGGLLRGNVDVDKWRRILRDSIWELEGDSLHKPQILPALKLSYDHLPSYLKQCFSYCSIFPKAYIFDRKELVKLWMAEAFIQHRGQNSAEETGREYFDQLLMRSFFQLLDIDNKKRYKMHDLIHELAVSVSSPMCCQVKDNEPSPESRHVSLLCQDLECPTCRQAFKTCNKLRTLLLPTEYLKSIGVKALDEMFHSLKYIRVLDLSSTSLSELPSSVEELKLLRSLDLSRTEIKRLPNSVCNLWNLQTLKLLGCLWLFELPKDLGKLVNLIYLELDEMFWFKSRSLPPGLGNLTRLQNLHAFQVLKGTTGHGIGELKDMADLTGKLHISNLENAVNASEAKLNQKGRLEKLVLEWSDKHFNNQEDEVRAERDLKDLQPHSNLKELALHHFNGSNFPSWMTDGQRFLPNLVKLTMSHCTKCTTISVGQLPCLRELYIKGMLELEEWPEAQCHSLSRVLHISNCPKLRKVPELMPNLRALKIKKCDSLQAVPFAPSLMFLTLIDNLVMENWQEGAVIPIDDQGNRAGEPRPSLIGLLELKLENCPNIKALPRMFLPQKLEIKGCVLVTALPVSQRLQHLALGSCSNDTLIREIPSTNTLYSLVISNISNLTSFPKLPHLPGLNSLYITDCNDLSSLYEEEGSMKSLSSLQLLSIRGCPKLESLPDEGLPAALQCLVIGSCRILKSLGSKQTLRNLVSLKDLYLEDCPSIQSFPEDGLPSSLQHLEIHGCPLLIQQCQQGGTECPKIEHVTDLEMDSV
ncbi:hypothetical protein like AT3G14470 [Hibiscus trionum]|uniref:Uncharacterized protein n=1 Tax=Hibiscus trionum TaxID=183268 RepID=A0A9W7GR51_HIBTR|nr:hypothetical protein like AT3G14470 [Hibiscus trionum]